MPNKKNNNQNGGHLDRLRAKVSQDKSKLAGSSLKDRWDDDFMREMVNAYLLADVSDEERKQTEVLLEKSDEARKYFDQLFNEIIPPAERDDALPVGAIPELPYRS